MSDLVDLDALIPEAVTVKFDGAEVQISPPSTEDVIRIGAYGQKLQDADGLSTDEISALVQDLTKQIRKCAPGLSDKELSTAQLLTLVRIVSEMSVPPDAKELEARGITPVNDDPKAQ